MPPPPIGQLVTQYIIEIFKHCEAHPSELDSLLDKERSNINFGINFPFCIEVENIGTTRETSSKRFWTREYKVGDKKVRVTSQWYERNRLRFNKYLKKIIPVNSDENALPTIDPIKINALSEVNVQPFTVATPQPRNVRYKGKHIGDAQNSFIRTLLSNIGFESFSKKDWIATKSHFSNRCAYCEAEAKLTMDHVIPINRTILGEHRLGNIVPSCKSCNIKKGDKDFREIFKDNLPAIEKIEGYMAMKDYVPLGDDEKLKVILEMAHKEVATLAHRYITIINQLVDQRTNE
jgi:hypothetical protein